MRNRIVENYSTLSKAEIAKLLAYVRKNIPGANDITINRESSLFIVGEDKINLVSQKGFVVEVYNLKEGTTIRLFTTKE